MLKIKPLNVESSSDEDATLIRKEAQEEIALDLYNKALRLKVNGQLQESRNLLCQLIETNIPQLESQGGGLPKTMSTLKYSCYVNVGNIDADEGRLREALDNYEAASCLDETDVTLWYRIGSTALKTDLFRRAVLAYHRGLQHSEYHWPSLDGLIVLLYATRDPVACLYYIAKALECRPNYMRGLVLRRVIYRENSAIEEYFKLYHPDVRMTESSDISVTDEDEEKCMESVNKLVERINELEKATIRQPLPNITLPKPLAKYTWLSVAETVINLHNHLTENGISHFARVSTTGPLSSDGDESSSAKKLVSEVVEKMDTSEVETSDAEMSIVRETKDSFVVTNGNSGGGEAGETSETTNKETDQETEDQDDQATIEQKRKPKRFRNLLLDLEMWGWHTKRQKSSSAKKGGSNGGNSAGIVTTDSCIEDAFCRILPGHLIVNRNEAVTNRDDDVVSTSVAPLNTSSLLSVSEKKEENYFGSKRERDDVAEFWTQNWEGCDAVLLVEETVHALAARWNLKWPLKLRPAYVTLFEMFREHIDQPQLIFGKGPFDEIRKDALATLLYGEFISYRLDSDLNNDHLKPLHAATVTYLEYVSVQEDQIGPADYEPLFVRTHWLKAHICQASYDNSLAVRSLELVRQIIDSKPTDTTYELALPNCPLYPVISAQLLDRLLQNVTMLDSLSRLESLYQARQYEEIFLILTPTFEIKRGSVPTSNRIGRPAQICMLIEALWRLDRSECLRWTASKCLDEATWQFLRLGKAKDVDKWEAILEKCLLVVIQIIEEESVCVLDTLNCDERKALVANLCRIISKQIQDDDLIPAKTMPLDSVDAWILLHYVLVREEHREQAKRTVSHIHKRRRTDIKVEEKLPPSIEILFVAHEFLGPKKWCLTSSGKLLHFMIDKVLNQLDTPILENLVDHVNPHIRQAFFCLYQHPSKRKVSKNLEYHNVNPLPLAWERAQQLFAFYSPCILPEFDSYRSYSISQELEQLYQRIVALVPAECDPHARVASVIDYINRGSEKMPDMTSLTAAERFPDKVRSIYYLLGDYYFKHAEQDRAEKSFFLDLCINPSRSDTWANLALHYSCKLEHMLNYFQRFENENEFLERAKTVRICFQRAIEPSDDPIMLWIEFGSFEYIAHSYCSRLLKHESVTLSIEKFEVLESEKENHLDSAGISFTNALNLHNPDQTAQDERWLHHYMLGKVAEKKRKEPVEYLQHYLMAAALLQENNATYPAKIAYNYPQHLSLEMLEIDYRIHASILKYLELHEGKPILNSLGKVFNQCLDTLKEYKITASANPPPPTTAPAEQTKPTVEEAKKEENRADETSMPTNAQDIMDALMRETMAKEQFSSPTYTDSDVTSTEAVETKQQVAVVEQQIALPPEETKQVVAPPTGNVKSDETTTTTSVSTSSDSSSSESADSDEDDDSSSMSSNASSSKGTEHMSDEQVTNIIHRCIVGLEECITRLSQNYKALYRLAHLFLNYPKRRDLRKCHSLLLGEYRCANGAVVQGLFADHKPTNFFNGIWRIPLNEIDRGGSLAAHMIRCVSLLLQALSRSNDHSMLLDVFLELRRTPDFDKTYIGDLERNQFCEQAFSMCMHVFRSRLKSANGFSELLKLLSDVVRAFQRVQKHNGVANNASKLAALIKDVYVKLMPNKANKDINLIESAIRFCQKHKAAERSKEKQKLNVNISASVPSSISITRVASPQQAQQQPQQQPQQSVSVVPTTTTTVCTPVSTSITPVPVFTSTPTASTSSLVTTVPPVSSVSSILKRPSIGRPRGRPPGPKQPRLNPMPRGRNTSFGGSGASWLPNMMYDQNMLKYREEFMRQYKALSELNRIANEQSGITAAVANWLAASQQTQQQQQQQQLFASMAAALATSSAPSTNAAFGTGTGLFGKLFEQYATQLGLLPPLPNTATYKLPPSVSSQSTAPLYTTAANFGKPKSSETVTVTNVPKIAKSIVPQSVPAAPPPPPPNISITPICVPVAKAGTQAPLVTVSSAGPPAPAKTLQEKLADKQKTAAYAKAFVSPSSAASTSTSSFYEQKIPPAVPSGGISVVPVSKLMADPFVKTSPSASSSSVIKRTTSSSTPYTVEVIQSKPPITIVDSTTTSSVSVIKKTTEDAVTGAQTVAATRPRESSSDDDVIIIE